jgi:hypothetical protein
VIMHLPSLKRLNKHSVLHSKHKEIQSELEKKSIMVKLIQDAYSKAKCCGKGEVVKNGDEVVPNTQVTVNKELEFADTAECTDEELLDLLRETEKNLSKDGVAAVGGLTTSVMKEKQNEEHTGKKKNGSIMQANEKHYSEAVALPPDVSPAKKKRLIVQQNEKHSSEEEHSGKKNGLTVQANEKHSSEAVALVPDDKSPANKQRLIVQENEKHSSEAAALPGVVGSARSRKEKENQSSEGASPPAVVSPPRNPPKKKNVSI